MIVKTELQAMIPRYVEGFGIVLRKPTKSIRGMALLITRPSMPNKASSAQFGGGIHHFEAAITEGQVPVCRRDRQTKFPEQEA